MLFLKIFFMFIVAIYLILLFAYSILSKKPLKTIFFNATIGLFFLAIIDLTGFLSGLWIPINKFTVIISLLGGAPAVILLILVKSLIFIA